MRDALHVLAQRDDGAGDLEADDGRRIGRRRIRAGALQAVGPVDAGVTHLDQHLAALRLRHRTFGDAEHVRWSRLAGSDVTHGGRKRHVGLAFRDG